MRAPFLLMDSYRPGGSPRGGPASRWRFAAAHDLALPYTLSGWTIRASLFDKLRVRPFDALEAQALMVSLSNHEGRTIQLETV